MKKLKTGYAYHGNRMLNHAEADLRDMAINNCNVVVHMLSHTDWNRHLKVLKEIVDMTHSFGMEAWMDNWGIGGSPGDTSHFLVYHPECHIMYSDGEMAPIYPCLNSTEFRKFVREWIDAVQFCGCEKIFWDEPHLPQKEIDGNIIFGCACPRCRKLFEEQYGYKMPNVQNEDVKQFRVDTIVGFFREMTAYSSSKGIENSVCLEVRTTDPDNMAVKITKAVCELPTMEDIGSDPYCAYNVDNVYKFTYDITKMNIDICEKAGKDHNIWVQTYNNPIGKEEQIVEMIDGCYDAGARTILAWSYHGAIGNDYRAKNPDVVRAKTHDAFRRIWEIERDRIREENRKTVGFSE